MLSSDPLRNDGSDLLICPDCPHVGYLFTLLADSVKSSLLDGINKIKLTVLDTATYNCKN